MCYNCISSSKNCPFDLDCNIKGTCHGTLISSTIENITNCQQNCLKDQKCLWHSYNSKTGNCLTFSDCFKIKSDLSPGFISRLKDISTPDFSTLSFNPGPFNPRLFNHELFISCVSLGTDDCFIENKLFVITPIPNFDLGNCTYKCQVTPACTVS